MYDIVIIGAGPAGLTAAIYALREEKKVVILEKETIGGKITSSSKIENYPGFKSISGMDFANNLYEQVINLGGEINIEEVLSIENGKVKKVITDENTYETKSIIIASGSKYKTLNLDKEEELIGNGISFCTVCDGSFYKNKDVCVVGGANSALNSVLYLSKLCNKVYLVVRGPKLKGDKKVIDNVLSLSNVEVLYNTTVNKYILDNDELVGVEVKSNECEKRLDVEGVFLAIGQSPEIDYLNDLIKVDENNYVLASEDCITNIDGIFVAGDVRKKKVRQLTTAVSDGTNAAINAINYLKEV